MAVVAVVLPVARVRVCLRPCVFLRPPTPPERNSALSVFALCAYSQLSARTPSCCLLRQLRCLWNGFAVAWFLCAVNTYSDQSEAVDVFFESNHNWILHDQRNGCFVPIDVSNG